MQNLDRETARAAVVTAAMEADSGTEFVSVPLDALRVALPVDEDPFRPTVATLRDRLRDELEIAMRTYQLDGKTDMAPTNLDVYVRGVTAMRELAEAIRALDAVAAREQAEQQRVSDLPVEQVATAVWHAAQEPDLIAEAVPGHTYGEVAVASSGDVLGVTPLGDIAAAAVRKVLRAA